MSWVRISLISLVMASYLLQTQHNRAPLCCRLLAGGWMTLTTCRAVNLWWQKCLSSSMPIASLAIQSTSLCFSATLHTVRVIGMVRQELLRLKNNVVIVTLYIKDISYDGSVICGCIFRYTFGTHLNVEMADLKFMLIQGLSFRQGPKQTFID